MNPKDELKSIREQIEALEERKRAIYRASVEAPQAEKVCDDYLAKMLGEPSSLPRIAYPLEVHGITTSCEPIGRSLLSRTKPGTPVKIRPCSEDAGGRTFLGFYIGDFALAIGVSYDPRSGVLEARCGGYNPAIWVPDLGRIVLGAESWWGVVESAEDLRSITDADINGTWYVQALKALAGGAVAGESKP